MNSIPRASRWLLLTLSLPFSSVVSAALQWENTSVEKIAPVGTDLVEVIFPFSNPNKLPVTILSVQPSCGCTTAKLDKMTYTPGENGALKAVFDGKGLFGPQEKTIQVISDDSPTPTTLTLRITIPPWLEASPRLVWWPAKTEAKPQEIALSLVAAAKATLTSVTTENPAMHALLQPLDDPLHYRLVIKPETTERPFITMVTLHLAAPGAAPRTYSVFAQVR